MFGQSSPSVSQGETATDDNENHAWWNVVLNLVDIPVYLLVYTSFFRGVHHADRQGGYLSGRG